MVWGQVILAVVEQYVQWRYGPVTAVGLILITLGMKERSANVLCVGGILVLLFLLSR